MTISALWTAASGMEALKFKINVIANNLANVSTDGFKRSSVDFNDLLYQYFKTPALDSPGGVAMGLGSRVAGTTIEHRQGSFFTTENNLDWAIDGIGFFQVSDPVTGETLFTRNGAFKLGPEGQVLTANGHALVPPITIPPEATMYNIGADGTVFALLPGSDKVQEMGRIQLARFANPSGLLARGNSLYTPSAASGDPIIGNPKAEGFGGIYGRTLEASNVEIVREMVDLIATQKNFDTNSKVISVTDKMMDAANNLTR